MLPEPQTTARTWKLLPDAHFQAQPFLRLPQSPPRSEHLEASLLAPAMLSLPALLKKHLAGLAPKPGKNSMPSLSGHHAIPADGDQRWQPEDR